MLSAHAKDSLYMRRGVLSYYWNSPMRTMAACTRRSGTAAFPCHPTFRFCRHPGNRYTWWRHQFATCSDFHFRNDSLRVLDLRLTAVLAPLETKHAIWW